MEEKRLSIYEILQNQALADKLTQNEMYFYRKICRWYSEKFHTPLHEVMEGSVVMWNDILKHYYESQLENMTHNEIYELAITEYLPEFADEFEKDNEEFAKELIAEQKRTLAKKEKKDAKLSQKPKEKPKQDDIVSQEDKPIPPTMNLTFDDEDV